jgi:hypothetical protein
MMNKGPSIPVRCLVGAMALAGTCGSAFAEGPGDRYWFEVEYFFPTITSTARLDFPGTDVQGTELRLEDDLKLEDRKGTPYLLFGSRLGENWRIEFEYYQLNRSATTTIARDIEWGDATFPAQGTVSTKFNTTIYRLTGGWSFYRTPQAEAGLAFGLHMTDFSMALSGQGTSPGGPGLAFQSEERDQLVPLPTIGLYGTYVISPAWQVRGRVDYLSLNYEQYNGRLTNWMAAMDWRFTRNWGLGFGYRYVNYRVTSTKENFHGEVEYAFKGPTLYVGGNF